MRLKTGGLNTHPRISGTLFFDKEEYPRSRIPVLATKPNIEIDLKNDRV